MRSTIERCITSYEGYLRRAAEQPVGQRPPVTFAQTVELNALKIRSSQLAPQIVAGAMSICGVHGYRDDGPYALGRHLRDAYSAGCMISNERLRATNVSLLLVQGDER